MSNTSLKSAFERMWQHVSTSLGALQLQLNNKANKSQGIYYIEGTRGTYAEDWLGTHEDITEYYPGLVVACKIPTSGGGVGDPMRLNINNLGYKEVVANNNTDIIYTYPIGTVLILVYTIDNGTGYWKVYDANTDTTYTTASANKTATKMYIIGATSQNNIGDRTYSNSAVYIGTDNCLYSNSKKVLTKVLDTADYGDTLPSTGTAGQIFFKKVSS